MGAPHLLQICLFDRLLNMRIASMIVTAENTAMTEIVGMGTHPKSNEGSVKPE